MEKDQVLERITVFADQAHGSQMRKYAPDKYIVHPVRVMKICRNHTDDLAILGAAILHDVLEDTLVTKNEIRQFLGKWMESAVADKTILLVEELTDVYVKKDFPQFNRKKRKELETERIEKTSADAQTIKYADILDNCSEIVLHDPHFARVFLHECRRLMQVMDKGNPVLKAEVTQVLNEQLDRLKRK